MTQILRRTHAINFARNAARCAAMLGAIAVVLASGPANAATGQASSAFGVGATVIVPSGPFHDANAIRILQKDIVGENISRDPDAPLPAPATVSFGYLR
jgi:hypothetical protein